MDTYRVTTTIQAKKFQLGDEDGFTSPDGRSEYYKEWVLDNLTHPDVIPYVKGSDGRRIIGTFGHYLCVNKSGEKYFMDSVSFWENHIKV